MRFIHPKAELNFIKMAIVAVVIAGGIAVRANAEGADREWAVRITRLNKLQARIQSDKKTLLSAIVAKRSGNHYVISNSKKIGVLKEIVKSYKDMMHSMDQYNHQTEILKYEYPEEGAAIDRHYLLMHKKPLHEYETQSGLEGELTALKNNIDKKYEPIMGRPLKPTVEQINRAHGILPAQPKENKNSAGRLKLSE